MKTLKESILDNDFDIKHLAFPRNRKELENEIRDAYKKGIYNLNFIDTSQIKDFSSLFRDDPNTGRPDFDISEWNVSNGEIFNGMFLGCKKFNSDLSNWDVSDGRDFDGMFCNCKEFNSDLSKWDVSKGRWFENMFKNCPIKDEYKPKGIK